MSQELALDILPNGSLFIEFRDSLYSWDDESNRLQQEIFRNYNSNPDAWLLPLGFRTKDSRLPPALVFWRDLAADFVEKLRTTSDLEYLRDAVIVAPLSDDEAATIVAAAPLMAGGEYLNSDLLATVWRQLNSAFQNMIRDYTGTVEAFFKTYSPDKHLVGRVFFHLVENPKNELPFAFLATYSHRLDEQGETSKHLPLKYALEEYANAKDKLLELLVTVHTAARDSVLLAELLSSGELFHPLAWSSREAFAMLRDIPIFEKAGILCRIPNWWTAKSTKPRLDVNVGGRVPSYVGMDAILKAEPRLFLGDMEISVDEARQLLHESEGLAFLKNKWVAVDPDKLKQALDAYAKVEDALDNSDFTLRDVLRLELNPNDLIADADKTIDLGISSGDWLAQVRNQLLNPGQTVAATLPDSFRAELREYQQLGLNWLCFLDSLRLGACLADDMGLGKTIQILAFLNVLKPRQTTTLLVVPASLIANWRSEIQRFAPELNFFIAHPEAHAGKMLDSMSAAVLTAYDLIITTYTLTTKYAWLQSVDWDYMILDEAQAIKNPGTKQTRTIKMFKAKNRIVMTGTPVENRLSDLWSLFDFLNPGLLGNVREFKQFSKSLKNDQNGYSRLRNVISPFILRRLKTDKTVINDLPDKVEMKTYASLSKRQVVLYEKMVRDIAETLEKVEGIQRKGIVLSSLMKFKQLCNHPDQYLGTGEFKEKDSGKFQRLHEICETILEKRERVLIFTQFKEIAQPLHDFLAGIFARSGLILHGGVPVRKRKTIIETFQNPHEYMPFMVLSLKAGGVGLNLTQANHVVHFDRWWNPAIENQATDRVFRIGQKKNVMVHKFLTRGTIEENIDLMLEQKTQLFEKVITAGGERWITEMNNDELINMFTLRL